MVHRDNSALPDNVKRFYNAVPSKNKKLVWLEGRLLNFMMMMRMLTKQLKR